MRGGLEPLEVDGETVWVRAPIAPLFEHALRSSQGPIQLSGKRVRYVGNH
jgi:hypothetical protein